ncbi:NADPH-dependent F420 reductase [Rhodoferax sp. WC2427]|uniref:NADPH-dependent F420 reductase n=1 Tax=Rhodoferax sp. WC2427 TaxID=3234144 RepID=UPI0034651CAC
MNIAFIGGGAIAHSIARLAKIAGHSCALGVRNLSAHALMAAEFPTAGYEEAILGADMVIIAVPYLALGEVLPPLAEVLVGKIVVDTTNAVKADWSPFPTGEESSAAEQIQAMLPGSRVAKAFNTIYADVIRPERLDRNGLRVSLFVASDHVEATQAVLALGGELGFDAVNAGPLKSARYLEAIAHLNLELAFGQGDGTNTAIIYHRADPAKEKNQH